MIKRCKVCAKKLNTEGKCTNEKCPNCIKDKVLKQIKA